MEKIHCFIILTAVSFLACRLFYWWGKRWKEKARHAYMIVGQHGDTEEEKEWGYRNALLAGEQKALMFYACAAMNKFMDAKPLTPAPFDDGLGTTIPFISSISKSLAFWQSFTGLLICSDCHLSSLTSLW